MNIHHIHLIIAASFGFERVFIAFIHFIVAFTTLFGWKRVVFVVFMIRQWEWGWSTARRVSWWSRCQLYAASNPHPGSLRSAALSLSQRERGVGVHFVRGVWDAGGWETVGERGPSASVGMTT